MSRLKRPSPALVVAVLALVAAIVVPAFALTPKEKRVVRGIANTQITKRAPGLGVARANSANTAGSASTANSAATAANADKLDGQDASDFTAAGEVHSPSRFVQNDSQPGDMLSQDLDLVDTGPLQFEGRCSDNLGGSGIDEAQFRVHAPSGTSFSGWRTVGGGETITSSGNDLVTPTAATGSSDVESAFLVAVTADGQVVSISVSAEVGDPAGDCVYGVTAVGP